MFCGNDEYIESNTTNLFVKNLALFYLKLNAKYHVPSSTANAINAQHIRKRTEFDVEQDIVEDAVQDFTSNDIYNSVHSENGTLSTDYRRKQFQICGLIT